jgi:hypothetical protein
MKTGTKVLIGVFALIIVAMFWWVMRTLSNIKKIKFNLKRIELAEGEEEKLAEVKEIFAIITGGDIKPLEVLTLLTNIKELKLNVHIKAENFSPQSFKLSQVYAEVKQKDGNIIARVEKPLKGMVLKADSENTIVVPIRINTANFLESGAEVLFDILRAVFTKEAFELDSIMLEGFVRSGWFTINFKK